MPASGPATVLAIEKFVGNVTGDIDIHATKTGMLAISELELELKRGKTKELFRLARVLGRTVPLRLEVKSKAERGYALLKIGRIVDPACTAKLYRPLMPANDINSPGVRRLASRLNELMPMKLRFRSRAEVARFFDGLELVEPGLVRAPEWRPDSDTDLDNPAAVWRAGQRPAARRLVQADPVSRLEAQLGRLRPARVPRRRHRAPGRADGLAGPGTSIPLMHLMNRSMAGALAGVGKRGVNRCAKPRSIE